MMWLKPLQHSHHYLLGEWFAKIIEGKMESEFDELCQKLNGKILQFLMDKCPTISNYVICAKIKPYWVFSRRMNASK